MKNKKIAIIAAAILCVIVTVVIVLNTVVIPTMRRNALIEKYGVDLIEKYGENLIEKYGEDFVGRFENLKNGDIFTFGSYEQDNNTSNGKETIEWFILDKQDNKALVISKDALDCKSFNTSNAHVNWESCTLRKWLNSDFIDVAFSNEEKALIPTVTVYADKDLKYLTNYENATQDQVFLLGISEANKYFKSDISRQCKITDYAVANGAYVNSDNDNCVWWLLSRGLLRNRAAGVFDTGDVSDAGIPVDENFLAVRPAMWIELS